MYEFKDASIEQWYNAITGAPVNLAAVDIADVKEIINTITT